MEHALKFAKGTSKPRRQKISEWLRRAVRPGRFDDDDDPPPPPVAAAAIAPSHAREAASFAKASEAILLRGESVANPA